MNRRTFNAAALAAGISPLPYPSFGEPGDRNPTGFQFAAINDGLLAARHSGLARAQTAVDDDTLFQVASCSKTVTALAVMTLVRDGRIDLDTRVNRYLRRWQLPGPRGDVATPAELMSHTAGTTIHGFAGYLPGEELPSLNDILSGRPPANSGAIRTRRRLLGKFNYSGGGTMVLQALIEDVTGKDFASYTRETVLQPVGAATATFEIQPKTPFAFGFYEGGQQVQGGFMRHPESAAAGLWATASDLARLFQGIVNALAGVRHAIIPAALAKRIILPVSRGAGLGVFIWPGPVIFHQGRNAGFDSIVAADLKTGRIRAAVTNRNGAIDAYASELLPD